MHSSNRNTTQQKTRALTRTQQIQLHLGPVYFNSSKSTISLVLLFKYFTYSRVTCVSSGILREADEICALLGYYAAYIVNFLPTFPGNVSVPYSRVKKSTMGPRLSRNVSTEFTTIRCVTSQKMEDLCRLRITCVLFFSVSPCILIH